MSDFFEEGKFYKFASENAKKTVCLWWLGR